MKREQEMQKEVENVIQKIKNLPSGTETNISKLLDNIETYSDEELTNMSCEIFEICDKEGIELDSSKYENQKVGLLYNLPFLVKKRLKREELAQKFYGYHIHHNIKDKETALSYLNDLTNYLNNYTYQSNHDFLMLGRKKFLYNEAMDVLDGKQKVDEPIYFVLGSLTEFMCSNNQIYATDVDKSKWKDGKIDGKDEMELKNKNDHYIKYRYISLEEKNEIMNFIHLIQSKIL